VRVMRPGTRALAAVILLAAAPVTVSAAGGPDEVIREASDLMLKALGERRAEFESDPDSLYAAVDEILLPRFDRKYTGVLVMGKTARKATPEQRDRFVLALYRSLLRTYAEGILDYRGDQLEVLPVEGDLSKGKAVVETRVTLESGVVTPVNYRMRLKDDQWRAYDVIIEGISYVSNYRTQYASEFRAKGIEKVIEELEAKAANEAESAEEDDG
jgi:phospholipid transport system substrate-binding protein